MLEASLEPMSITESMFSSLQYICFIQKATQYGDFVHHSYHKYLLRYPSRYISLSLCSALKFHFNLRPTPRILKSVQGSLPLHTQQQVDNGPWDPEFGYLCNRTTMAGVAYLGTACTTPLIYSRQIHRTAMISPCQQGHYSQCLPLHQTNGVLRVTTGRVKLVAAVYIYFQ